MICRPASRSPTDAVSARHERALAGRPTAAVRTESLCSALDASYFVPQRTMPIVAVLQPSEGVRGGVVVVVLGGGWELDVVGCG